MSWEPDSFSVFLLKATAAAVSADLGAEGFHQLDYAGCARTLVTTIDVRRSYRNRRLPRIAIKIHPGGAKNATDA